MYFSYVGIPSRKHRDEHFQAAFRNEGVGQRVHSIEKLAAVQYCLLNISIDLLPVCFVDPRNFSERIQ